MNFEATFYHRLEYSTRPMGFAAQPLEAEEAEKFRINWTDHFASRTQAIGEKRVTAAEILAKSLN